MAKDTEPTAEVTAVIETTPTPKPIKASVFTGIALESRKLADTEGITVAAAVEKLTKIAAAKNV